MSIGDHSASTDLQTRLKGCELFGEKKANRLKASIKPVGFDCFKKLNKLDNQFHPEHLILY